jgi:hypothetical protein
MGRIFFQRAPSGFRTVRGELIKRIQETLKAGGFYNDTIDGTYGGNSELAVQKFQQQNQLSPSGKVDDETWQSLMSSPAPDLKQRCLQVTADFEGTGFTKAVGNFDGAGITWGIIGFTLSNGELGALLKEIETAQHNVFLTAFGDQRHQKILEVVDQTKAKRIAFANSISVGTKKMKILDEWDQSFIKLGSHPAVQEIQLQRTQKYFDIAQRDVQRFSVKNELGLALCFDIAVQNGGIDQTEGTRIRNKIQQTPPATQQDLRLIITNVVAENSNPEFIEDVRKRKLSFAAGTGTVHGSKYNVKTWGLDEFPAV